MSKPETTTALRARAEQNVLKVRGSYDAPGFEACVNAEMERLQRERREGPITEWGKQW